MTLEKINQVIQWVNSNTVLIHIPGRNTPFRITTDDASAYDLALQLFFPEVIAEQETMEIEIREAV